MRQFYQKFEKIHALRGELTWTHYRLILKVEEANAREFYVGEAIAGNWSTRQLERQIFSLYYERILLSSNRVRQTVKEDSESKIANINVLSIMKDPFVLEFLDVKENEKLAETELESALIKILQQFLLELGNGFAFVGCQYRLTQKMINFILTLYFTIISSSVFYL